ncbi:MAG: class I SAM-dependent methyltransferase [Alicyclobacillus herbarius]|uniref:class I SAM-dependent methyltransferase n=1 Tax=Alicyclobacillus herbarius TaxID=122960 RepID=UPI00041A1306|nr:class I SAM-dependent methyltransferase [Alicyclobacillus herbarius]MCL6631288.1 class I SAM-dependent methyltransferase [Alicyclobacillus herbarius]
MDYQDVLAVLGTGSAHPGGFRTTLEWLRSIPLDSSSRVLEVGCGTGRTLVYAQQQYGCYAVGVDVRREMVNKAKRRAALTGAKVEFIQASAEDLPFPDASFDVLWMESVNVFVEDVARAFSEYARVLRDGGQILDVEMMLFGPVTEAWRRSAERVYGARRVPDLTAWKKLFADHGFTEVKTLMSRPVRPEDAFEPDPIEETLNLTSANAFKNPDVIRVLTENAEWMQANHRSLAYVVLTGWKQQTGDSGQTSRVG